MGFALKLYMLTGIPSHLNQLAMSSPSKIEFFRKMDVSV